MEFFQIYDLLMLHVGGQRDEFDSRYVCCAHLPPFPLPPIFFPFGMISDWYE